ncbi:hypothetical protein [uncultured Dysgonomonas sp.]|nr:hypothetical protein [uncultured Dysgonomonas sp.]
MMNPIADITAIAPTTYKSMAETTFTPTINKVRNNNIDITPTDIKKYFNTSMTFNYSN